MSNAGQGSLRNFALGPRLPPLSSIAERPGSSKTNCSYLSSEEGEVTRFPPEALLDLFLKGEFDTSVVQELLEARGVDLNLSDSLFGWTSLHFAANNGSVQLLDLLIRAGALLDAACRQGNVALHLAARGGHCQAVECLIVNKAGLDVQNGNGWTALTWSAINGRSNIASRLLEATADIDIADCQGRTASMWAARHGHLSVIQSFLNLGFDLNVRDHSGFTVLDHAIEHLELWFALHAAEKANLSLFKAVKLNDLQAVLSALQASAHVNAVDADGWTPLLWAATCGSQDLIKLLARSGGRPPTAHDLADVSRLQAPALRETLMNALMASDQLLVAAKSNDWLLLEEALSDGAWVNTAERGTLRSSLMWVAAHGATDLCRVLVSSKAKLEQRDCNGSTALLFGVCSRSCDVVLSLVDLRAKMDITNYDGEAPLHLAAALDDPSMVWTLINERCELEMQSNEGFTPVQVAAHRGAALSLGALIKYGADVSVKDNSQRSLLAMAVVFGHMSVVRQLLIPPSSSKRSNQKSASRTKQKEEPKKLKSQTSSASVDSKRSGSSQVSGSDHMLKSPQTGSAKREAEASLISSSSSTLGKSKKKREPKFDVSAADPSHSEADNSPCPATPEAKRDKHNPLSGGKKREKALLGKSESSVSLQRMVETPEKVKPASPSTRLEGSARKTKLASCNTLEDNNSMNLAKQSGKKSRQRATTPEKSIRIETPEKVKRGQRTKSTEGAMSETVAHVSADHASVISKPKEGSTTKSAAEVKTKKSLMSPGKWLASKDNKGRSALSLAVQFGRVEILTLLLQLHADVNAVDDHGDSALMLATQQKSHAAVELLLGARAAVGLRNKQKQSALEFAADRCIRQLLTKSLIESKVSRLEKSPPMEPPGSRTTSNLGFRLRVEGLPVTLTADLLEGHLRDLLRPYTSTSAAYFQIAVAPISEKPRGYAYVDFANSCDAGDAMQCDGSSICGHAVRVFREPLA